MAEISPALHEIIVAVSRKAVDERMEEIAVTRQDFEEVKGALRELAEAQARTEARMEELAQAQARTEARVGQLENRMARVEAALERLAEAQVRTEARVEELAQAQARTEARMEELAQAQARTEARMERVEAAIERLTEAQTRTEAQIQELVAALERTDTRVADLKGWQLELRYRERAGAYFGPLLRRVRTFSPHELEDELEPRLSADEFEDLLQLDLLISGRPRHRPEAPEVWLAVEVSAVVDRHDLERAQRRAAALRRAGYRAIPTVAGEQITAGAEEDAALAGNVLLLQDGRARFWEEALAEALKS